MKEALKRAGLFHIVRRFACELFTLRQNFRNESSIRGIYRKEYHVSVGYGEEANSPGGRIADSIIKREHAESILDVLPLRKVLVGGCSGGMAVKAFREAGIEAWGFDISPNLGDILLPDVARFVKCGSMTSIPFSERDAFDALITSDVLEHVQLRRIDLMFSEMEKLRCPWMVHLINHTQIQEDHMTLKPLRWWERRFVKVGYVLRRDLECPISEIEGLYGLNGNSDHRYTFWERAATR